MSGNVKFSKSGMTTQHIAVRSHVDPALQIPNCSQASPSQANFDIWHGEILDALVQIWGPPILVHALSEPEFDHLASNKIEVMGSDLFEAQADTIVPGLIRVLNGSSETGRAYAADAFPDLGFYKGPKTRTAVTAAVPSLILLLSDPNTDVQRAAIRALGEIRADASPAVPFLLHFLPGQDDNAYEANFALVKITGKDFGFDVSQWELWWSTGK
jgi:HEAT repeat protein